MAEDDSWWKDDTKDSLEDDGFGTRSTQNDAKDFNLRLALNDKKNFDKRDVLENLIYRKNK
ncbi:hypothetical protein AB1J28_05790 [Lysinibacillus irui]|uniref:hypothetical protein n=1 Tax=Lysinibacillus irui TaxID=2998077 RepID=UPI003D2E1E75